MTVSNLVDEMPDDIGMHDECEELEVEEDVGCVVMEKNWCVEVRAHMARCCEGMQRDAGKPRKLRHVVTRRSWTFWEERFANSFSEMQRVIGFFFGENTREK